ncbi:MAG: SRPBCC family protein [Candidatus Dormibacteria bacterium]
MAWAETVSPEEGPGPPDGQKPLSGQLGHKPTCEGIRSLDMPTIEIETLIRAPVELCFDLSVDVDVHQQSVAGTSERAVAGITSGRMGLGDEVTWEARHLGRTRRLSSRITEYERPSRFVDEMVSGPFKSFRHVHTFVATGGGTRMIDGFAYRSPLGVMGRLADVVFLERYMRRLLEMRNQHIKAVAEGSTYEPTAQG